MKYLHEAVIIAAVTFAAEIIKFFVPLPVPASRIRGRGCRMLSPPSKTACPR